MKLVVVRHGVTAKNMERIIQGIKYDDSVTPRGLEQMRALVPQLREYQPAAVYSSPLMRTRESATLLAEPLGLPIVGLDQFIEVDFGHLERMTYEAASVYCGWVPSELLRRHLELEYDYRPYRGECVDRVEARVREGLQVLRQRHADQTIVVVTHGAIIRMLHRVLEVTPPTGLIGNGCLFELSVMSDASVVH